MSPSRITHVSVLKLHSEPVGKEWLDAYGHLNEAYFQAERWVFDARVFWHSLSSLDAKIAGKISP